MKSFHFVLLALLAIVVISEAKGGKGKGKGGKWREMLEQSKCKDLDFQVLRGDYKTCRQEVGGGDDSDQGNHGGGKKGKRGGKRRGKNACVAVCAWKKQGLLDSNGNFNPSGAESLYEKAKIPSDVAKKLMERVTKCNEEHGSNFSMENKCESYKQFKRCQRQAFFEECGIPRGKRGRGKGKKNKGQENDDTNSGSNENQDE